MDSWPAPSLARLPGTGLPVRVYDTASGGVRPLDPGDVVRLYVCGITPYDATHLGHAATYLAFDLLQRVLRDGGHDVDYVQNVTDVDDPLLERAHATGEDWRALAERETELFRTDMTALRMLPPRAYVTVTEAIPLVVRLVEQLLQQNAAYLLDGDIYFSTAAAPRFGEVSHYGLGEMLRLAAERGGDPERPGKKDPLDPLLWLAARPGEPSWPAPFGPGRPGWHVECTAIALEYLGSPLDVQGGGADLIFPHHEFTAAQAEAATGAWPFARFYVHAGMVGLDGEKMSKSRGNLVFVSRLREQGIDPMAIRLALLGHRYRADWEWSEADLDVARDRLARWRGAVARSAAPSADELLRAVRAALADDLDAPRALAAVDRWVAEAELGGRDASAPGLMRDLVDTLLGIAL